MPTPTTGTTTTSTKFDWSSLSTGLVSSVTSIWGGALANDAAKIKADADTKLEALKNQGNLTAAQYTAQAAKITADANTQLATIKAQQSTQNIITIAVLLAFLGVVGVVVVYLLKKK